jgi:hypothetical protein
MNLLRRPVDDPEVKEFLKLDDELVNGLSSGVLEDVIPYLKDIFPTAKWKKLEGEMNEAMAIIRTKFKEHVETFEPG